MYVHGELHTCSNIDYVGSSFPPIFHDFFPLFPDLWQIFRCQGWHPAPLDPPPSVHHWIPIDCAWACIEFDVKWLSNNKALIEKGLCGQWTSDTLLISSCCKHVELLMWVFINIRPTCMCMGSYTHVVISIMWVRCYWIPICVKSLHWIWCQVTVKLQSLNRERFVWSMNFRHSYLAQVWAIVEGAAKKNPPQFVVNFSHQ